MQDDVVSRKTNLKTGYCGEIVLTPSADGNHLSDTGKFSIGAHQYTEQEVKAYYDFWKHRLDCEEIEDAIALLSNRRQDEDDARRAEWINRNSDKIRCEMVSQLDKWQIWQGNILSDNNASYTAYALKAINDMWAKEDGSAKYVVNIRKTIEERVNISALSSDEPEVIVAEAWETSEEYKVS